MPSVTTPPIVNHPMPLGCHCHDDDRSTSNERMILHPVEGFDPERLIHAYSSGGFDCLSGELHSLLCILSSLKVSRGWLRHGDDFTTRKVGAPCIPGTLDIWRPTVVFLPPCATFRSPRRVPMIAKCGEA